MQTAAAILVPTALIGPPGVFFVAIFLESLDKWIDDTLEQILS